MIPLSTAKWDPAWFAASNGCCHLDKNGVINGLRAPMLSPENDNCHGPESCQYQKGNCPFIRAYSEQLHTIDFQAFVKWAEDTAYDVQRNIGFEEEPVIILLVYETPDNPCSERKPLQQWFHENGIELNEFDKDIDIEDRHDDICQGERHLTKLSIPDGSDANEMLSILADGESSMDEYFYENYHYTLPRCDFDTEYNIAENDAKEE